MFVAKRHGHSYKNQIFVMASSSFKPSPGSKDKKTPKFFISPGDSNDLIDSSDFGSSLATFPVSKYTKDDIK